MWPAGLLAVAWAAYNVAHPQQLIAGSISRPVVVDGVAFLLRFIAEASAWAWAAERPGLPAGMRRGLRILAGASLYSSVVLVLDVAVNMGVTPAWATPLLLLLACGSFILGLVGLFHLPRMPTRPRQLHLLSAELVLITAPMVVLQVMALSGPGSSGITSPLTRGLGAFYAFAQVLLTAGLGVFMSLGAAVPSRRAFWWFVASLGVYVPNAFFNQLYELYHLEWAARVIGVTYFGGLLLTLRAATYIRRDPLPDQLHGGAPRWLLRLNPVTLVMPLLVGTLLLLSILDRAHDKLLPLGLTVLGMMVLLVGLLVLAALENARLVREEREIEVQVRLQREQARAEERSRLVADMHDGFASQLISARLRAARGDVDRERMLQLLDECLADLTLVVDSMHVEDGSLATALAEYRARLSQRVEGTALEFHWEVALEGAPPASPHLILQVLRVVQEAISNALKHAQARHIHVMARCDAGGLLQVSVADDGRGLQPSSPSGRGMQHMARRAAALGGTLSVGPVEGGTGTQVALAVPLRLETPEAA
ncbi:MAG: hypothetical protein RL653_1927 [Pseudomonadota bacterium]|jgi:signal transduction histidine kinase